METMTAQEIGIYTEDDLEQFRAGDDRLRFELIDGELFVTPSPSVPHQVASARLMGLLLSAAPDHVQVLSAPLDVRLAHDTVIQPDLLVVSWDNIEAGSDLVPLLVVEVLSPSTRRVDLSIKKDRLERAGVAAYWVVDPLAPSLRAWDLRGSSYRLVGGGEGSQTVRLASPFPVQVTPAALVSRP